MFWNLGFLISYKGNVVHISCTTSSLGQNSITEHPIFTEGNMNSMKNNAIQSPIISDQVLQEQIFLNLILRAF